MCRSQNELSTIDAVLDDARRFHLDAHLMVGLLPAVEDPHVGHLGHLLGEPRLWGSHGHGGAGDSLTPPCHCCSSRSPLPSCSNPAGPFALSEDCGTFPIPCNFCNFSLSDIECWPLPSCPLLALTDQSNEIL